MAEGAELVRLLRARYESMGDTIARQAADEIEALRRDLRDETKLNATILKERDTYGQRWRHWEVQANALLGDAEAWREHCRKIESEERTKQEKE